MYNLMSFQMSDNMFSNKAVEFIKIKEGFNARISPCPSGFPTLGYGHRVRRGERHLGSIEHDAVTVNHKDAHQLLVLDLQTVSNQLVSLWTEFTELNPNQRDAIISLVFNWGIGHFKDSKLFTHLKVSSFEEAAHEFLDITKSNGKVLQGLVARRQEERAMFLSPYRKRLHT